MARFVRLNELLLGIEGTALYRSVLDGDDAFVAERIAAMRKLLEHFEEAPGIEVPELGLEEGYASWAASYDTVSNAMIRAEQPLVAAGLDGLEPGTALDAACGTGRLAELMVIRGHKVIGVDRSRAMLLVANEKVPDADFRPGELDGLPFDDDSFDVATCGLAVTHLPDPAPAIAEMARVVRPGGRIILSDPHPTLVTIQGQALFPHGGGLAFVRNHAHLHGTYLRAFHASGLRVLRCDEPSMDADFRSGLMAGAEDAARALFADLPAVVVWRLERT